MSFWKDIGARVRALLAGGDGSGMPGMDEAELRQAIAALLVRALVIDGDEGADETMKLVDLLKARFDLTDAQASDLVRKAKQAEQDAADLFRFTRVVTEKLDRDGRIGVLEMMFEIVAADGRVDVFEENLMSRAAVLLRLPDYYREELRPRVFALMAGPDDAAGKAATGRAATGGKAEA